jgi:hypothetical protein
MTDVTSNPRVLANLRAVAGVACGLVLMVAPQSAAARPYTVISCDAAGPFGFSSAAWTAFGNAGSAYESCPTGGGSTAGVSNRLIDGTYSAFNHSGHAFRAPPGATITAVRWAGRLARDNCNWGTFLRALPSGAAIMGLPNGQYCTSAAFDNRGWPMTFGTPEGTTGVDQLVICGATQCFPGATIHSQVLEVTVDDPIPPSISLDGPLVSGLWVSGRAGQPYVTVASTDNAGVQSVAASVGAESRTEAFPCTWALPRPCATDPRTDLSPAVADLPDGGRIMRVSAIDAAGNTSVVSRAVYIDNTPPDPIVPQVVGGDAWRRTNSFVVTWPSPPQTAAPIGRAHWKLCTSETNCGARGHADGQGIAQLPALAVPAVGDYRLYVWLEDQAGNQREESAVVAAALRFDAEPPQLTFEATDPADPLRVAVNALDRHSGVATGAIEMRAVGASTWHGLATGREGSQLVAHVDDERFRNGAYEFRAHAVDHAGNEASTGRRADGSAATLRLPARIETQLAVGVPRVSVRRRIVRRHGRRKVLRRRIRRLDSHVIARHGRTIRLSGLLANSDGQPIEGATIEAVERHPDGATAAVGLATTGSDGRFRYVVKATRNRELVFRYGGSRRIGSATSDFVLLVPASTSIRPDRRRLRNGQQVLFTGRVRTRPLPSVGKLVEMQAHFRGRWRTFSTVRAGNGGGWRFPYRFGGTVGTVTYRFRARLPSEGGYPFISGNSRVVRVVVVGG